MKLQNSIEPAIIRMIVQDKEHNPRCYVVCVCGLEYIKSNLDTLSHHPIGTCSND